MSRIEGLVRKESNIGLRHETALITAIRSRQETILRLLLERGADPNCYSYSEPCCFTGTPFQVAVMEGQTDLVGLLLSHGADINADAASSEGRTALQAAVDRGNVDMVHYLLSKGAHVNGLPAQHGGATALQIAAIKGYVGLARILLAYGADPDAPPARKYGRTALEGAAEYGRLDMLQLLLNAGAMLGLPASKPCQRVFRLAYENGHMATLEFLKSHQNTLTESFGWPASMKIEDGLEDLRICECGGGIFFAHESHHCAGYDLEDLDVW